MQTQLPRRPFVELPPPVDGLSAVRREASRRRRRAAGVVAGGVTAVIIVTAALLVGGGAHGDAVLRPAPAAPATGLPTPGSAPSVPPGKVAARSYAQVSPAGHRREPAVAATTASTGQKSQTAGSDSITLTRTRSSYTGSPRICRTGDSADKTSVYPGANWCPVVTAVAVDGGVRLSFQVCRDSTSGGSLNFGSSREVDFVVKSAGKTVWSWSHDHPGTSSQHTLSAPADGCWNWTLVWPGVDESGAGVVHGDYTVTATSTADELYGAPAETTTFRY